MPGKIRLGLLATALVQAISAAQLPTEFEVASVKPNHLEDHIVTLDIGPGGRFAVRGYTLGLLIQQAYGIMGWGVTGGPDWIRSDRFDITAKALTAGDLNSLKLRPMLQNLLSDRFKLKLHTVPKEMSGYELTVARSGPKLKIAAGPEAPESIRMWNSSITGQALTPGTFAVAVGSLLGLPVVDKTNLPGLYDFKVSFAEETPDFPSLPGAAGAAPQRERDYSSLFSNLERELGLKLTARRVKTEILQIDSAEQPSPN